MLGVVGGFFFLLLQRNQAIDEGRIQGKKIATVKDFRNFDVDSLGVDVIAGFLFCIVICSAGMIWLASQWEWQQPTPTPPVSEPEPEEDEDYETRPRRRKRR